LDRARLAADNHYHFDSPGWVCPDCDWTSPLDAGWRTTFRTPTL
jgi:hypothetical protein